MSDSCDINVKESVIVIFCDAAPNKVSRVVNNFGKKMTFDNGGYRAGVFVETPEGPVERRFVNQKCPDQFAGECWSVLKAIEVAKELGFTSVTIRNDRIDDFDSVSEKKKRIYAGGKYLFVAKKIAEEAGIEISFDRCSSAENLADRISRTE